MKIELDDTGYPVRVTEQQQHPRCYTVPDIAEILSISRASVYQLLKDKKFPWFRIGKGHYRIPKEPFDRWIENNYK